MWRKRSLPAACPEPCPGGFGLRLSRVQPMPLSNLVRCLSEGLNYGQAPTLSRPPTPRSGWGRRVAARRPHPHAVTAQAFGAR
jgi:hypothetical protein